MSPLCTTRRVCIVTGARGLTHAFACRARARIPGSTPDIAVKELECFRRATEDDARREAASMQAVTSLQGCLDLLGKYAAVYDDDMGGAAYYLAMPCALLPSLPILLLLASEAVGAVQKVDLALRSWGQRCWQVLRWQIVRSNVSAARLPRTLTLSACELLLAS